MTNVLFRGSGVALVTPFTSDGIDDEALRELVGFHLREGTDALVVNGSTGEAATMSPAEQRRSIEVVVDAAGAADREVPVIAGVGGSSTADVERLAAQAREAGADALLLAPPPYNKPTEEGLVVHYRRVLDAADLPMIVYNIPGRTASNLSPQLMERLADDARVVGIKEASGDIAQIVDVAHRLAGRVALYSGNDDQVLPILALGGQGVVSVVANVIPGETARMVRTFLDGEVDESRRLLFRFLPLIRVLFRESNPIPAKAALAMLGFRVGEPRLPLLPVSDGVRDEIRRVLAGAGLLPSTS